MSQKQKGDLRTGKDFVNFAEKRGAKVTHNAHGGFTSVETPAGKVFINPSSHTLDKQTIGNLKRWFRLLGIMVFIMTCCAYPIYVYITENLWRNLFM